MDANDVMSKQPVCLHRVEKISTMIDILKNTNHNGYPVIGNNQGCYLGTITRDELYVLLEKQK